MEHYTKPYLLNPPHKITVHLAGVGGTGSVVLSGLARIHKGLQALNHPGIHVRVFDPDTVSMANVGRQMFSPADLGISKAVSAVTRINRFFGYDWEAYPELYNGKDHPANILITCVDTAKARLEIASQMGLSTSREETARRFYWLDFGNLKNTGQVVLGTVMLKTPDQKKIPGDVPVLPCVHELFDLADINEEEQGPSCSLAEAISRQDLFINSTLADLGLQLLWKLFTAARINYHGVFLNLASMQVRPIPVTLNNNLAKQTKNEINSTEEAIA